MGLTCRQLGVIDLSTTWDQTHPIGLATARVMARLIETALPLTSASTPAEGAEGAPKMLSVGLHCRIVGRPARLASLERFLDHVQSHEKVWITRRIDIANHWRATHPADTPVGRPV